MPTRTPSNGLETANQKETFQPESWAVEFVFIRAIRILVALSGGQPIVRLLLTASSVIPVMPACMLTVPNPGSRNEWPSHCDGGIHYVWPCNFGPDPAIVIVLALAAHLPRKQNKAAKQYH